MYTTRDLLIKNSNNQKIIGKIFVPENTDGKDSTSTKKYPAVICSHGFNSCYNDLIHHGPGYAEAGIVCVFFDFCGGGERTLSDGTLEDMTVLTETEDLLTIINSISTLDYVDEKNIFLLGESMGGFVSAYLASDYTEDGRIEFATDKGVAVVNIAGLILWYPAFVIPEDSKKRFENDDNTCFGLNISPDFNFSSKDIDIEGVMEDYTGPVQLIHGDQDPLVPLSYSQKALATYSNARLEVIPGAGHGFEDEDSRHAREVSIDFIRHHIN